MPNSRVLVGPHDMSCTRCRVLADGAPIPCKAVAQLHIVGEDLDCNLRTKDANGELLCGVGMRLQQETRFGVYVASLTANGPAEKSSMIREGDRLVQIDDYSVSARDTLENIRSRVLGRPSTEVTLWMSRTPRSPGGRACSADEQEYLPNPPARITRCPPNPPN